jgi:hypothetical protein
MSSTVSLALFFILLQASCGSGLIINPTPTLVTTVQATATKETSTLTPTSTPIAELWGSQSYSSNQKWVASIYKSSENGKDFLTLVVEKQDGSSKWIVEKVPAEQSAPFAEYPSPLHWSKDGTTFYFTHQGYQDGCFSYSDGGKELFSVDLATGNVNTILNEFAS